MKKTKSKTGKHTVARPQVKSKSKTTTAKTSSAHSPRSKKVPDTKSSLLLEVADLRLRLGEAEETLTAIRNGEVDALVVSGTSGEQIYTLKGAEQPYRILVESINEGALSLTATATINNCNKGFAKIMGTTCGTLIGTSFRDLVSKKDRVKFDEFWKRSREDEVKTELELHFEGKIVPVYISAGARVCDGECWVFVVVTDITERKKTEAELEKYRLHLEQMVNQKTDQLQTVNEELETVNEELQIANEELLTRNGELIAKTAEIEAIIDSMSDAMIYTDKQQKILLVNPATTTVFGYYPEELVGKTTAILYSDLDDFEIKKKAGVFARIEKDQPPFETWYRRKNGNRFVGETRIAPVRDTKGASNGFISIYRDITERKLAEETLRESEAKYKLLTESIVDGFAATDQNLRYTYWNKASEEHTGIRAEEAIGKTRLELFGDNEATRKHIDYLRECIKTRQPVQYETEATFKDRKCVFNIRIFPASGGVSILARDITDRKMAEEALQRSEEHFRSVLDNSLDCIYRLNLQDNRYEYVSPSAEKIVGFSPEELKAQDPEIAFAMIHPDDILAVRAAFQRMEETGEGEVEYRQRTKSGDYRWLSNHAKLIKDKGRPLYRDGSIRDITERKKAEADLLKLSEDMAARNTELESVNKELEAYTYSVSHDLRAPLRSVSGFAKEVINEYSDKLDARGKDYLTRIFNGSEKMARLINDLLRLSNISRQEIARGGVDLSATSTALVEELRQTNPEREVHVEIKEGLTVLADHALMKIALENLIENAWKFTSKIQGAKIEFGTIEKDGKTIYFIKDNGAGFDQKYAENMFAPFKRLHTDKEFEGTGIGLAIVERIISKHGGKVWAEGEVNKGATVFFTL